MSSSIASSSRGIGKPTQTMGHGAKSLVRLSALAMQHNKVSSSTDMDTAPANSNEAYGAGGSGSGAGDTDPQPIPRPFKENQITFLLTFSCLMEIDSINLKYLQSGSSPTGLFSNGQTDIFNSLAAAFPLMHIGKIKQRMSNFVFLLDEIGALGSTPVTTTAITPQMYFMHFHPSDSHSARFALCSNTTNPIATGQLLAWKPSTDAQTQRDGPFVNMTGLDSQDGIEAAGLNTDSQTMSASALYTQFAAFSAGELQTRMPNAIYPRIPDLMDRKQFSIVNPGDVLEFDIETQVQKTCLPTNAGYFRSIGEGTNTLFYHWPCRAKPLGNAMHRKNATLDLLDSIKLPFLRHHYFICPPIKKSDNTFLKQRVSGLFEASCPVTLYRREDHDTSSDANVHPYANSEWHQSTVVTATNLVNFWQ